MASCNGVGRARGVGQKAFHGIGPARSVPLGFSAVPSSPAIFWSSWSHGWSPVRSRGPRPAIGILRSKYLPSTWFSSSTGPTADPSPSLRRDWSSNLARGWSHYVARPPNNAVTGHVPTGQPSGMFAAALVRHQPIPSGLGPMGLPAEAAQWAMSSWLATWRVGRSIIKWVNG